ncbi:hypothetical protein [Vulcanisaeta distributa]|uniref:Uncharacterized protein n=1 Tax=Vulcanisaeta distributa (strain DSM 14429 / JCM 11212 / NBRC 100878 / IC-017) TaxID=572478 RepID=E1QP46_VULDI|nr:hypothetical protein [Vulcanisaeta distributa]ADN50217.1 hypothetical protein Vdis_0825 [Vulcanisaeta distributa DSM 14429]
MFPEAVPIIDQEVRHVPNLVFTNKLAIELRDGINPGIIRRLGSLSKEVIGITRVNDEFNSKLPNSLSKFNKVVIILGPEVGESWLKYVMSLTNTIVGFTLDSLMRFVKIRPGLLNIPNELFIDPIVSGNDTAVQPKALPKAVIDWLMDYVDSGGDLYVLARGDSINNINLLMHSRLIFTYNIKLAELYNSIIKGGFISGTKISVKAGCDFCGNSPNPLCLLICPNVDLIKEIEVE